MYQPLFQLLLRLSACSSYLLQRLVSYALEECWACQTWFLRLVGSICSWLFSEGQGQGEDSNPYYSLSVESIVASSRPFSKLPLEEGL